MKQFVDDQRAQRTKQKTKSRSARTDGNTDDLSFSLSDGDRENLDFVAEGSEEREI